MLETIHCFANEIYEKAGVDPDDEIDCENFYLRYLELKELIAGIRLVSNHYLALHFDEPYLQDSQHGAPHDKWMLFLQRDLDKLHHRIKNYLLGLAALLPNIKFIHRCKDFYAAVDTSYQFSVKKEKEAFVIYGQAIRFQEGFSSHEVSYDVSTYDDRLALKESLHEQNRDFDVLLKKLRSHIKAHCTIDDLLG